MNYSFDYTKYQEQLVPLLQELETRPVNARSWHKLVNRYPKPEGGTFSKDQLVKAYRHLAGTHGLQPYSEAMISKLRMKPVRTASGVAPLTVLTKPFPCPGKCIFCPNDIRMPKSYLSDEPGAQRAERNYFDPYLQTYNRLQALDNIGHTIDKVEIIVLGGTWSYYPEAYQIWFIKECFRALNDYSGTAHSEKNDDRQKIELGYQKMEKALQDSDSHAPTNNPAENKKNLADRVVSGARLHKTYNQVVSEIYVAPERLAGFTQYQQAEWPDLESEQLNNERAGCRCVGLVVETRPDNISEAEILRMRRLGCTKTQIGFQSLQDEVLVKNKRGHDVAATRRAVRLLRQAGFKIHAHWMANLYGSNVTKDKEDFAQLFSDPDFQPDELKIYPCSLIGSAELMQYYQVGLWLPYSHEELLEVLSFCLQQTPEYCRLTRVIRDIPSTDIVEGNKLTNFRQIAEQRLALAGEASRDIRAREIRSELFDETALEFQVVEYTTSVAKELFLQYCAPIKNQEKSEKKLLGFLRLSLPTQPSFVAELHDAAIVRELHVYGQVVGVGRQSTEGVQHLGLGSKLLEKAKALAQSGGFQKLAVISAIGTREYYRKQGFQDGELYQFLDLHPGATSAAPHS